MQQAVNGGPAFPVDTRSTGNADSGDFGHQTGAKTFQFPGLTKRELIAAMAMQGVLASSPVWGPDQLETQASTAVQLADALLAELAKGGAA